MPTNYNSENFYKLINRAYTKAIKYEGKSTSGGRLEEYLQTMSQVYTDACNILSLDSNSEFYEALCKNRKKDIITDTTRSCHKIKHNNRTAPPDIDKGLQFCKPGSLKCLELKNLCESRNHCFDDKSKNGPRCFYQSSKTNKYHGLNTPNFYSSISRAGDLLCIPKYKNNSIGKQFKKNIDELINLARIVEFNTDDKKSCNCQTNLKNPDKLTCYPC